jgi:hypothetical protein
MDKSGKVKNQFYGLVVNIEKDIDKFVRLRYNPDKPIEEIG